MMSGVMDGVVADVAKSKSGQGSRSKPSERQHEERVKDDRKRNANDRRHYQPRGIIRIIVMHTMHDKMKQLAQPRLWLVMENVAVDHVLQQRPNQNAQNKKSDN